MKTVADFKRALKVGTKVHGVYHAGSKLDESGKVIRLADGLPEYTDTDLGDSEITIVQSTQFAIKRVWGDGVTRDSWCKFPKASECEIKENSITIYEQNDRRGRVPILTYTIL